MTDNLNQLDDKLKDGHTLVGFSNTLAADGVAEAVARLGLDFLWIDAQHGRHTSTTARAAVREAQAVGLLAAIRVPGHEYGVLGPFLDTGAEAIIVPMVESPEQAAQIVRASRFAPRGGRSFGGRRVCDIYGFDYHHTHEPVVIAQIESGKGLENAEAIIATDGIDMLLLGSVDLAIDLGWPKERWRIDSPDMGEVLGSLVGVADKHGKTVGCVAPGPAACEAARRCGCRFISAGDDTAFLTAGLSDWLSQANTVLKEQNA
jgi:4-hydroxy-2-oxoheptanedioate aldolase